MMYVKNAAVSPHSTQPILVIAFFSFRFLDSSIEDSDDIGMRYTITIIELR